MDMTVHSNQEVSVELAIDMDFDQMTAAILDYFKPDYKSDDEISSWYEGFLFYKDRIPIFYYNHYDLGNDRHCFEIKEENAEKIEQFKNLIRDFREYLKGVN